MLGRSLTGDALWQCLCPRYPYTFPSTATYARTGIPAQRRNTSFRPATRTSRQPRRFVSTAPVTDATRPIRSECADRRAPRRSNVDDSLEQQASRASSTSTEELYSQLAGYASRGQVQSVEQAVKYLVCDRHEAPNLRLYSALILSNVSPEHGSAIRVKALLTDLIASGLSIDAGICHEVIKVLSVHLDYVLRNDILEYMRQRWFAITPMGYHYFVAGQLREGQLNIAREWLRDMTDKDIPIQGWLQELAVYTFLECGEIDEALALVRSRWERGEREISESVWSRLLDLGSAALHHASTAYVWSRRVNLGQLNPSAGVCFNSLSAAADAGDVGLATDIFSLLGKRSTVFRAAHYVQLQQTYLNAENPDLLAALNVLMLMAASGLKPTPVDTRPLFEHLTEHPADIGRSLEIFHRMRDKDQIVSIAAINVILEALVHLERFDEALQVYKLLHTFQTDLKKPFANIETFHQLILGARSAEPVAFDEAEFLANELDRLDLRPDKLFYDRMILVCHKAERTEAAWKYCDAMVQRGWRPRPGTAKELVRLSVAHGGEGVYERCVGLGNICPELRDFFKEIAMQRDKAIKEK